MMDKKLLEELKNIPILCVEEEDDTRKFIVNALKCYFNEAYEAKNINEACGIYEDYKPKIVFTDIQMKDCHEMQLVRKIRKNDFHTSIVILTEHSNKEYLIDLINLNVNHFILKPLSLEKLDGFLIKYVQKIRELIVLNANYTLDLIKRELIFKEKEIIHLRKRERDFLHLLYEKKGGILSYYQIETQLWIEKEMTSHALKSFIKELRAKLPDNIIKNVPLEGYALL